VKFIEGKVGATQTTAWGGKRGNQFNVGVPPTTAHQKVRKKGTSINLTLDNHTRAIDCGVITHEINNHSISLGRKITLYLYSDY
jgi:hypothetical protein